MSARDDYLNLSDWAHDWPELYGALDEIDRSRGDLTACRSELASIAILLQERGQLPDPGGKNFALVAGAVTEYVLAMELAVVALNEDRQHLPEQIGGLNNLLACDDDCYHAPMCPRWEGHAEANCDPNDPNIT